MAVPQESGSEMLAAFVEQFTGVPREEFLRLCPHPFLLMEAAPAPGVPEAGLQTTRSDYLESAVSLAPSARVAPAAPARELLVPVTPRVRGPALPRVSVGRTRANDIVLAFEQVSKLHAFLVPPPAPGRCWSVADAGSTNGTHVNGLRLGKGEGVELVPGDVVDFGGGLPFGFFTPEALHPYLPVLARRLRARASEEAAKARLPRLNEGTSRVD
ncbi:MAG: FHA domain-containing protein [Planctomycetales bacterium]|nr:FHA domain-containing protein [Planctomycetales bacterium]